MSRFKKGSTQFPAIKEEIDLGSHKLAALKEWLVNIVGNRTLGRRVKRNEVRAVVGMGWWYTWKETDDGGRKPKARFFAKGFLDGRLVDTYVGTPSVAGINTVCLFIVATRMEMGAVDVTAAFLTSKDHNAERLFDHKLEGVCKELGFRRMGMAIAVKAPLEGGRAQAIVMNWIDDLLTGAPPKEHKILQETLNKRLGFGSVLYLENTDTAPLWEILKEKRPSKPWKGLDGKSAKPSTEEELDTQYEKLIRAGVGTLQWGVRMNLLYTVWGHTVVQSISKPSRRVFKTVIRIIKMLKGHSDKRVFTSVGLVPVVHAYFDAAFKFATYAAREMRVLGADLQWIARARNVANVMTKCALPGGEMA
uniref:Reverse transcriptase Ty1/copia-type domain-containing protein n=1 Tax=Chromera velia CCMP2878 TaxID=1169474 RepID=A0A0G4FVN9_9ALVE|eukprot:Cvel_18909.t1-p1 / transcript=Cvel_18909.t1 / gene=Cvel_18909 / organism=Chromera_velia_CCMP2878 / gene_product=hypothetical protein / transcript_product=hypothetical protein / location=Cvel_scaffold1593:20467-22137(+) / protein_length=362 / sequence_SO=supercontig / SO=protein_coding / is_pseudo=false